MNKFDILIAGGGIAGLYIAYKLHKENPAIKIAIIESTNRLGGRIYTIKDKDIQYEAGGARFNNNQHRILSLIDHLKLTNKIYPIKSDTKYIPINRKYDEQLEKIFPTLDDFINNLKNYIDKNNISNNVLLNTTILNFIKIHYKQYPTLNIYLESLYPYYSELAILNCLESINLFSNELSSNTQYSVLSTGLGTIIDKLLEPLKNSQNTIIYLDTPLLNIFDNNNTNTNFRYRITTSSTSSTSLIGKKPTEIYTNILILALPQIALNKINYLTQKNTVNKMIKSIKSEPLYRIYARYPVNSNGLSWFSNLDKITTNQPIKYIIPINSKKGLIMISYTDSKYAKYWLNHLLKGTLPQTLNKQLKLLFPNLDIPRPKWIKHHYWDMGAGYWLPGSNKDDILPKIIKPISDKYIYICGENYSSHQAWVEGALETSDIVLKHVRDDIKYLETINYNNKHKKYLKYLHNIKKTKKHIFSGGSSNNEYTLEEVAKHNKKTDAWIIIGNIVADITKWIPTHPGGNIIMKGVGKDATTLFKNIGHSDNAKSILKKYQIGKFKK